MVKKKREWDWHKLEVLIDKSIPYLLVVLFVLIILELFYHDFVEHYLFWIDLVDYFIILVFVADLIFKWQRAKGWKDFLKTSWLDILAVFPFYLVFRLFEEISVLSRFSEGLEKGQKILHETVEVEKEVTKVASEVEKAGKLSRTSLFTRFIKPIQRLPRFLKVFHFYEKPVQKKNLIKSYKPKKNKSLKTKSRIKGK